MTCTATGPMLDILGALEPEAKTAWEAEEVNLVEAIALSQAITDRRMADIEAARQVVVADGNTIALYDMDPLRRADLPSAVADRNDPTLSEA